MIFSGKRTLSSTLAHGSSVGAWNTRPVSARGSATGWPSMITRPWLAGSRPPTSRKSVDFPHPDGPTRHTNSLRRIERETLVSAAIRSRSRETKCFDTFSISITCSGLPLRVGRQARQPTVLGAAHACRSRERWPWCSFFDQGGVDGLPIIPFGIELLGVGDRLPRKLEPLGALLAPAVLLGVIVIDEAQRRTHAADAIIQSHLRDLRDVQLARLLGIVAREFEGFLDRPQEPPREVRLLGNHLVGGDDGGCEDLETHLNEGKHDDLLAGGFGRLILVIVVDGVEGRRVEVLGDQLRRHGRAVHAHPGDLAGIGSGALGDLGKIELVAVAGRDADLLALKPPEIRDSRTLQLEQRVWRLGVDDGNGLDRNVLARPGRHDGRHIRDAEVKGSSSKLRDGVARAVAAGDCDVDALFGENALLPAAIVHGVLARRDPIRLEADLVLGQGGGNAEQPHPNSNLETRHAYLRVSCSPRVCDADKQAAIAARAALANKACSGRACCRQLPTGWAACGPQEPQSSLSALNCAT